MTTGIGTVAAGMSLASPEEGGGVPIPALAGVPQPVFEDLDSIDLVALQGSADQNPWHRFGHIEPRARTGGVQEANSAFLAPFHPIATVMACQIIQNEQPTQGRVPPIQLLGGRKPVPIVPAPPLWNYCWGRWTVLEDGSQLALEPGR